MKYLIEYNESNNMKGSGAWSWVERFCPLCGIALNMSRYFDEKHTIDLLKEDIEYLNGREENITVLFPQGKNYKAVFSNADYLFNIKEIGEYNLSFYFYGDEKYHGITDDNKDLLGLPMHTCCWNLAKKKFKHELTFEDFFYNKFEKIIPSKQKIDYYDYYLIKYLNYKPAYKYTLEQYWDYNINNEVGI